MSSSNPIFPPVASGGGGGGNGSFIVLDADVGASAAIQGSKITPSFGNQIVSTSSTVPSTSTTTGALIVSGGAGINGAMYVGGNVTVGGGSSFISTGDITGVNIRSSSSLGQGISFNANGGNFLTQSTNTAIWLNYGPQGGPGGWSTLNWDFATYDGGSSRTEMSLTRGQLSVTGALTTSGLTNTGTTTLATNAGVLHSSSGGVVSSSKIINADVDSAAAIDGTKVVAASALVGGVLTTGAQTISGDKTFSGTAVIKSVAAVGTGTPGNTTGNHPYLATKLLTGTTASSQGLTTDVAHGLTLSTILGCELLVEHTTGTKFTSANYTQVSGYQVSFIIDATNVTVELHATNSANVLNKNFKILIQYTA